MEHFSAKYELLFCLQVKHPLFKDRPCDYLMMQPDESTARIFNNRHLIVKSRPGELKIVTQVSETINNNKVSVAPFFNEPDDRQFYFLLKVRDVRIFETTNLDFSNFPTQFFYFFKEANATTLSVKKCLRFDKVVFKTFSKEKMPARVRIIADDSTEIYNQPADVNTGTLRYDMKDLQSGFYTIITEFGKVAKPQEELFYFNPLARRENFFGIIQIPAAIKLSPGKEEKNTYTLSLNKN